MTSARKLGFHLKSGYVVIAIPDSGLFVKDGILTSGNDTQMKFDELVLFSRRYDAEIQAGKQTDQWRDGDVNGHQWEFKVLPVLVSERL